MTPAVATTSGAPPAAPRRTPGAWARDRLPALAGALLLLAGGLLYTFFYGPVVEHVQGWQQPGDLWSTYHVAQTISWGNYANIYGAGAGLVSFPAMPLALAPLAWVADQLGLVPSFPFYVPHTVAWIPLDVVQLLVAGAVLLPLDALAADLGATRRRRWALAVAGAVVLFPLSALYGHPEDAAAIALALTAFRRATASRWREAGWLFGVAVAFQPLVLLVLPLLLGVAPDLRQRVRFAARTVAPAVVLLVVPLVVAFHTTVHAIVDQPNEPSVDHATPWLFLAPVLSPAHRARGSLQLSGRPALYHLTPEVVGAGPGRLVALGLACALGVWVARRKPPVATVVWLMAVAFALRCCFESVMDSYYYVPALLLVLVSASTARPRRWWGAVGTSLVITALSQRHLPVWVWWAPLTACLVAGLWASAPRRAPAAAPEPVP